MFRPVPLWVLLLCGILGFAFSLGFGALILEAQRGGSWFRPLQAVAVTIADTPSTLRHLFNRVDNFAAAPGTERLPVGFWRNPSDPFRDPGYVLLPLHDAAAGKPYVHLLRLSDGRVLRDYRPDSGALAAESNRTWTALGGDPNHSFWIGHPDLLSDGGILFSGGSLMVRIGACAETRWTAGVFTHSIERDADGNYWAPFLRPVAPSGDDPLFREDGLTLMDVNGRRLFERSSSEIFAANGLEYLVRGRSYTRDPYHLNDIQPVLADGPFWRRGDVFLSYREQSMVMLYRPSTGRILWWRAGPWRFQHDVTILDDHRIGVFDNHARQGAAGQTVIQNNRFIVYDFASNRWSAPYDVGFRRWNVRTTTGGRALHFANGDLLVEDTNGGQLLRMTADGRLRWRFVHGDAEGGRYRLDWARYLDPETYRSAIAAAMRAQCQ